MKIFLKMVLCMSLLIGLNACKSTEEKISDATVKVTNITGNSGGSGTILMSSKDNGSQILTNSHVCEVLKGGGKITTSNGESHLVKSYLQDTDHDLCLVRVAKNLKINTKLSNLIPEKLNSVTISGHPQLLPTIQTKGHISDNTTIQVFTGIKPCTDDEFVQPDLTIMCILFGGLPVFRTYEATVISSLIMPGSSGSGVYDEYGNLTAVAFAGSQGLSFAFTVPYSYVISFINRVKDKPDSEFNKPNYVLDIKKELLKRQETFIKNCQTPNLPENVRNTCKIIIDTLTWRN